MPVADRSSRLSYAFGEQRPALVYGPDHNLTTRPSPSPSPTHTGPNTTFASFTDAKFGDLSRVSWVWGAPSSLSRALDKDGDDSIRIEVVSETDAVGHGQMLNPYTVYAPKGNNVDEPDLNAGGVSHSFQTWSISEVPEEEEPEEEVLEDDEPEEEQPKHDQDRPASFVARFPHTESLKPPTSIQDIHDEYHHPRFSHKQFQDRDSATTSTNTLSYVSAVDDKPVAAASVHRSRQSAHTIYPSLHHYEQRSPVVAQPIPWPVGGEHQHPHHNRYSDEMSEIHDQGQAGPSHPTHDPWGEHPATYNDHKGIPHQGYDAVYPTFNEAGPSKLPPIASFAIPRSDEHQSHHHQQQLPPLSTGQPFIPQRLSQASSISMRSGYGKYREPVLPQTFVPGARLSQPTMSPITYITPITPKTPHTASAPVTPSAVKKSRFKFPIKFRSRSAKANAHPNGSKELPQIPSSPRLLKKQSPSLKSRTSLVPQEQDKVELYEIEDGSSWVVYSH